MEDQANDALATSRRHFTKAIVAAAVAVPIVVSMTGCPKPSKPDPCTCPEPQPAEPIKCEFRIPGMETEPHEPPIIVSNGSLRVDLSREFDTSIEIGPGVRNYRYKLKEEYFTEINRVQVLTEREKNISTDYYYLNFRQAYLGLWLQKNTAPADQDPVWTPPISGEPQILFSFYRKDLYNYFALETDLPLTQSRFKRLRRYRYEHPGYAPNQAFRLTKWSLFYPTFADVIAVGGTRFEEDLTATNSASEGFQLAVTFEHVDHYRKRNNITAA